MLCDYSTRIYNNIMVIYSTVPQTDSVKQFDGMALEYNTLL